MVSRIDTDTFVVLIPNSNADGMGIVMDRIKKALDACHGKYQSDTAFSIIFKATTLELESSNDGEKIIADSLKYLKSGEEQPWAFMIGASN